MESVAANISTKEDKHHQKEDMGTSKEDTGHSKEEKDRSTSMKEDKLPSKDNKGQHISIKKDKDHSTSMTEDRRHSWTLDGDLVKQGILYVKRPPTNVKIRIKTWQKRWIVLRDGVRQKAARLDIICESGRNQPAAKKVDRYSISLITITHLEKYLGSKSYPHAFVISRRGLAPVVMAADTQSELDQWMGAIQLLVDKHQIRHQMVRMRSPSLPSVSFTRDKPISMSMRAASEEGSSTLTRSRPTRRVSTSCLPPIPASVPPTPADDPSTGCTVKVVQNQAAKSNNLFGNYLMVITPTDIALARGEDMAYTISWPLKHINKFKSEEFEDDLVNDLITLEASLVCGIREGTFQFTTNHGKILIKWVRDAVKNKVSQSQSSNHGFPGRQDTSSSIPEEEDANYICEQMVGLGTLSGSAPSLGTPDYLDHDTLAAITLSREYLQVLPDEITEEEEEGEDQTVNTFSRMGLSHRGSNCSTASTASSNISSGDELPEAAHNRKDSGVCDLFCDDGKADAACAIHGDDSVPPTPPPRPIRSFRPLPPLPPE